MTAYAEPSFTRNYERVPPSAIDAEMCVLASMMLDKDVSQGCQQIVTRDDFFQADHQIIFDVLVKMHRSGQPVDVVLLRAELDRKQLLEEIGGTRYLAEILDRVPSAAHGEHYAGIVREKAVLRRCISASNDLLRDAYAPISESTAPALARRYADELALIATTGTTDRFQRLGAVVDSVLDAKMRGDVRRIPTGLSYLDGACGGLPLGRFILIGGRPGSGKSMLCKQFLHNVGAGGQPIGLVTIEESADKVAENAISNLASVENNHVVRNNLSRAEWDDILRITPDLAKLDFFVNDEPTRLSDVESAVTSAAVKHGCKLVVVDYLQLIDPDSPGENENREITKISKTLKAAAKRLDIALVVACQLNRGNETGSIRKPTLRDLRGSGSLEQDGDLILLLHREDYYHYQEQAYNPTHQLEIIIAKNKDGCQGVVPVRFSGKHQRITDWESDAVSNMGQHI